MLQQGKTLFFYTRLLHREKERRQINFSRQSAENSYNLPTVFGVHD